MKWQFWRRMIYIVEHINPFNRSELTPDNFPAKELFKKSTLNWRNLLSITAGFGLINILFYTVTSIKINSSYFSSEISHGPFFFFNPFSFISNLLLISGIMTYIIYRYYNKIVMHYRLQKFTNIYGINAFPSLLELLRIHILDGEYLYLTDSLLYNLKALLSQVNTSNTTLNSEQFDFMYDLIDPKGFQTDKYNSQQLNKLKLASIILSRALFVAISRIGEDKAIIALEHRLSYTKSSIIRNEIDELIETIKTRLNSLKNNFATSEEQTLHTGISSHNIDCLKINSYRIKSSLIFYGILPSFFYYLLHLSVEIHILDQFPVFFNPIYFSAYCCSLVVLRYLTVSSPPPFFKTEALSKAVSFHPASINVFLQHAYKINSSYTNALILSSLLENTNLTQLEPLDKVNLNYYYTLLKPSPFYNLQFTSFQEFPLPDVGEIPIMLRGLIYLGDSSSVKFIERFCKSTENEEHKRVALECMDALNARLSEKPEQLLRASSLSEDALLRASQPSITADELVKPMVAEERIVFPQNEELDELEVRQQL